MNIKTFLPTLAMFAGTTLAQQPLASGLDKANMDLSADPGTDFFRYAAGGWMDSHPLTPEFSRFSQFDVLNETNNRRLRELIEEMGRGTYPREA